MSQIEVHKLHQAGRSLGRCARFGLAILLCQTLLLARSQVDVVAHAELLGLGDPALVSLSRGFLRPQASKDDAPAGDSQDSPQDSPQDPPLWLTAATSITSVHLDSPPLVHSGTINLPASPDYFQPLLRAPPLA